MRRTLTWQIGLIFIFSIIFSVVINSITNYRTAYINLYDAAGVEAYGCAYITTGLLTIEDIENLSKGLDGENIGNKINWTVDHKDIFENQYILSLDGTILALDDNMKAQGFSIGEQFYISDENLQHLIEMKHPVYSEVYEMGGMDRLTGYAPIFKDHDPSKEVIAISAIDFNADIVSERTWNVVKEGILLSIIPLLVAVAFSLYFLRKKTKPITRLIERTKTIANGDLTEYELEINSNDEVGDLAVHIKQMSDNLREIISTIKETSHQLSNNINNTTEAIKEINTSVNQVAVNMQDVAIKTSDGAEFSLEASQTLENLNQTIIKSKVKADHSVVSANETMDTAINGIQKIKEAVQNMDDIKNATASSQSIIQSLSLFSEEIQEITNTITNIASQTNLLALNASIEAARAGEHGKGFTIVAEQIRNLAEQSNIEAKSVENLITKIIENIHSAVSNIEISQAKVSEGERVITETGTALDEIRKAVESISKEIHDLSELTTDQAKSSKDIVALVKHLERTNENIAAIAQDVSAATEETSSSVAEVTNRTDTISEMTNKLDSLVDKFKLA